MMGGPMGVLRWSVAGVLFAGCGREVLPFHDPDAPPWSTSSSSFSPAVADGAPVTVSITFAEQDARTPARVRALGREMVLTSGVWSVALPWELLQQQAIEVAGTAQDDVLIDVVLEINEVGYEEWQPVVPSPTLEVDAQADFVATAAPTVVVTYPIGGYLPTDGYPATLTIQVADTLAVGQEVTLSPSSGTVGDATPTLVPDPTGSGAVAMTSFEPTSAGVAVVLATLGTYTAFAGVTVADAPTSNGDATLTAGASRAVRVASLHGQLAECEVSVDAAGVFVDAGGAEVLVGNRTVSAASVSYTFGVRADAVTDGTLSLLCWDDYLQEHLVQLTAAVEEPDTGEPPP